MSSPIRGLCALGKRYHISSASNGCSSFQAVGFFFFPSGFEEKVRYTRYLKRFKLSGATDQKIWALLAGDEFHQGKNGGVGTDSSDGTAHRI